MCVNHEIKETKMKKVQFIAILLLSIVINYSVSANENKAEKNTSPVDVKTAKPSIIALAPHIVEMLYDIGAGEQIIGTTAFANYPEEAKKIPIIGNYVRLQLERVIELQPDLIIAWQSGNPSDDLARLKQLGFNIVYSQPNSFKDIASEMRQFAQLTGHEKQGEQQASQFEKDLAKIKSIYAKKDEITGFYELWSRPLTTVAKKSWPQQFLNICKVANPFRQSETPYPQIGIEQLLPKNIKLIIQPLSINQKEREAFNWKDWPIIPAVRDKNIIQPDADAIHRMTGRSLKALDKLCSDIDHIRQSI